MQVYRHPRQADTVILSVAQTSLMHSLLTGFHWECLGRGAFPGGRDAAADMQYDQQNQWFTMSTETYRRLRNQLPSLSGDRAAFHKGGRALQWRTRSANARTRNQ
jgi:hypothetical protein